MNSSETAVTLDRLKKELVAQKLMARQPNGRYVVQRPIFSGAKGNKGYESVHAFRAKIIKDEVVD